MAHGHHHGDHAPGATHEALPLDPEHDIDARSATLWVVGGTIVLFLSLWVMVPIFMRVLDKEREHKIDKAATTELHEVLDAENEFLNGANPTKKTIQSAIEARRPK
jgi:beta-lactamase regulating signal transducer with metallopeptidase domain